MHRIQMTKDQAMKDLKQVLGSLKLSLADHQHLQMCLDVVSANQVPTPKLTPLDKASVQDPK